MSTTSNTDDGYVGEIRMFAGHTAPLNWHFCDGSKLFVSQFPNLFQMLSTTYGGDGVTTFGIPNLLGRVPIGIGQGSGLTNRNMGDALGAAGVALDSTTTPTHTHLYYVDGKPATTNIPGTTSALAGTTLPLCSFTKILPVQAPSPLDPGSIGECSGGQPHPNVMPSIGINFMICCAGTVPSD